MLNKEDKISIIVPAYNEEKRLAISVGETIRTFSKLECVYEIIIVDDGSSDATLRLAKDLAQKYLQVIVRQNRENRGKGRALKLGFRAASGNYVVFLDADMDLHPEQISTFFDIMELDGADVVIGSKMHPNSIVNYPLERKFVSKVYFWFIKLLFQLPINDTQTGLKLFKYKVLNAVFPKILVRQFAYDLEILALTHRLGFKIAEAPVVLRPLEGRQRWGRITLTAVWSMLIDTLAIFYRMYVLKYYDRLDSNSIKE